MKLSITLLTLLLLSCSPKESDPKPSFKGDLKMDPTLAPYIDLYFSDAKAHGRNITRPTVVAMFVDDDRPSYMFKYSGHYQDGSTLVIAVSKMYTGPMYMHGATSYKSILYRPLTNALLGKPYKSDCSDSEAVTDIMCRDFHPINDDQVTWDVSLDELFN